MSVPACGSLPPPHLALCGSGAPSGRCVGRVPGGGVVSYGGAARARARPLAHPSTRPWLTRTSRRRCPSTSAPVSRRAEAPNGRSTRRPTNYGHHRRDDNDGTRLRHDHAGHDRPGATTRQKDDRRHDRNDRDARRTRADSTEGWQQDSGDRDENDERRQRPRLQRRQRAQRSRSSERCGRRGRTGPPPRPPTGPIRPNSPRRCPDKTLYGIRSRSGCASEGQCADGIAYVRQRTQGTKKEYPRERVEILRQQGPVVARMRLFHGQGT